MTDEPTGPRIYVASLSDYNAGRLHGRWIDATQDADAIWQEVSEMLAESPEPIAEEWAIHDYEGFGDLKLSEWESFKAVSAYAQLIERYSEGAVSAWLANRGGLNEDELDDADDMFSESYLGEWRSVEEYAEDYLEQTGTFENVNDTLKMYFDFEKFAHDLELGGDIWTAEASGGGVHIFSNN